MNPRPPTDPGAMPHSDSPKLDALLAHVREISDNVFAPDGRIVKLEKLAYELEKSVRALDVHMNESLAMLTALRDEQHAFQKRLQAQLIHHAFDTMPAPPPTTTAIIVLIVDDEPLLQRALDRLLTSSHITAVPVFSAEEACLLLAEKDVSVALIDIRLRGEMSGIELVSFIQRDYPQTSCLLMSGLVTRDDAEAAERLGVPVIEKPFGNLEMVDAIRRAHGIVRPPAE